MAKRITGISDLRERIDDVLERIREAGTDDADLPRNSVVLVDYAWDLANAIMPDVTFLTDDCERIAKYRSESHPNGQSGNEDNSYLVNKAFFGYDHETGDHPLIGYTNASMHGTACAAVLKIDRQFAEKFTSEETFVGEATTHDKESDLWNICPETNIVLSPVREFGPIDSERFNSTFRNFQKRSGQREIDQKLGSFCEEKFGNIGEFWSTIVAEVLSHEPSSRQEFAHIAKDVVEATLKELAALKDYVTLSTSIVELMTQLSALLFEEAGITKALAEIESQAKSGRLKRGDVVVMPIEFRAIYRVERESEKHPNGRAVSMFFDEIPSEIMKLPVIVYPDVERAIERLTCEYEISVVISSGNVKADLAQMDFEQCFAGSMCGTIGKGRENLFKTYGVSCGAILVGATDLEQKQHWLDPIHKASSQDEDTAEREKVERIRNSHANHGICVDAFGRGAANTVTGYLYEKDTLVDKKLYAHWCGASIAAVVTAAGLATLQLYRISMSKLNELSHDEQDRPPKALKPLKPFEARSHFRVYRALDSKDYPCRTELMGPPPDLISVLNGSNVQHC